MLVAEPVAVVGLGCRLPGGADSPERFWDLLNSGRSVTGKVPEDRWQPYKDLGPDFTAALRRTTRWGAYLPEITGFDAEFFGISPREAEIMDPQQRIMLEVTWEALEHAGIPPHGLAGTDAGVFVGVGSDDYGRRMLENLPGIEAWTGIGGAMCAVANRVSHALDLRGPSLAVDTACSASLVAVHLACQSLRLGESTVALAAGVNLIISPGLTLTLDAAGAMAPDGRCKSFDAAADGYGRGEGCGVLVLKRLADASADGDRVLALILGSAVNQDGRTNGIMAPSKVAQEHVVDRACRQAGVAPETVGYVEAHGTGTRLGDPVEASALGAVYGTGRDPSRPCLIGSVKTNIGHLEAAAGIAGLIKTILALGHDEIPPSLNFTTPNPAIGWDVIGLRVVSDHTRWPSSDHPRRAGVSGFGYGGTIAHVVLEQAPRAAPGKTSANPEEPRLFPLSAGSDTALRQQAARLADWLRDTGHRAPLASVGHTLALRRSHLIHRAAVVSAERHELIARLRLLADGQVSGDVVTDATPAEPGAGLVWVFSGHGSQWDGMGRELLATEPAFASVLDELDPIYREEIGFTPRHVLMDGDLKSVDRIQTMIFAMQLGLAELWRHHGVTPDAVIGHSVGEIAAAVVAGALSRRDGARLICRRSRLLSRVAGDGAMAMAKLPFREAQDRLSGRTDVVAAISSSPASTVISGETAAVGAVLEEWRSEGIQSRLVASDVAFHSPQMDPLLADLRMAAADLSPGPLSVPMYPTALEDPNATPSADGAYWAANLRNPVRLSGAIEAAARDGYRAFLEVSPHPVVTHSIIETLAERGLESIFAGSTLRRNLPERATFLTAVGAAHCHGIAVDWARLQATGEPVALPATAWQHRSFWRGCFPAARSEGHDLDSHSLLGPEIGVAGRSVRLWRTTLDEGSRPYPGNHTINDVEIVPAAVLINTFLRAASPDGEPCGLTDVALRLPLVTSERREIQVIRDGAAVRIASAASDGDGDRVWLTHATAAIDAETRPPGTLDGNRLRGARRLDPGAVGRHLVSVGVPSMGFAWTVRELLRGDEALRARVIAVPPAGSIAATWAPVLDAALSVAPVAYPGDPVLRIVAGVDAVWLTGQPPEEFLVDITVSQTRDDVVDVVIADTTERPVGQLSGVRCTRMDGTAATAASPQQLVHNLVWRAHDIGDVAKHGCDAREVILVAPDASFAEPVREGLAAAGAPVRVIADPDRLDGLGGPADVVVLPPLMAHEASIAERAARCTWLLARTAQRLAASETLVHPRLWCVTAGIRESSHEAHLPHAPLWGLGRVIAGEHPELWGGTIDLDPERMGESAATLLAVIRSRPDDDVISVRDGIASVARLARIGFTYGGNGLECRPDATYLVTGGLGALGLDVAHWLADRGARRIVLAGRRPLPRREVWNQPLDEATRQRIEAVRALEARGVTVRSVGLDIADIEKATRKLSPDTLGLPPIRGVVHAAGVLDNRLLMDMDEQSLRTVMRPKVDGAWTLHTLFPPGSLDFLALFSSCGHLLRLPGQASYGSANAFMDALARHRHATGHGDTISFGWTSWRGQGMANNDAVSIELQAIGVSDISADEAFGAWDRAQHHDSGYVAVMRLTAQEPGAERPPVLRDITSGDVTAESHGVTNDLSSFSGLDPGQLHERLLEEVGTHVAAEMRLSVSDIDPCRSLTEQGMDSVMTVIIRRRLERRFRQSLPATLLWNQPTLTAIADHIMGLLG